MRYLILTDIHANLEALETCLKDARGRGYDESLVLGDIVGYGPDPNAVIEAIRRLKPKAIVRGNHDKVALGMNQAEGFHAAARAAAHWMLESLTEQNREWLVALPMGPTIIDGEIEICHGAPFDEDAYIFDELDARHAFEAHDLFHEFVGHEFGQFAFGDLLAQGVHLIAALTGELVVDGLELLAQVVLALVFVDLLAHARLDALLQVGHLDFFSQVQRQLL